MEHHSQPITSEEFEAVQAARHTSLTHVYPESPWFQEVWDEFMPYIQEPFIDIGTRSGSLLAALKERGIEDVTGLEVTDLALHDNEIGRRVIKGDIQKTTPFNNKQFKSATMLHCLEHCYDPVAAVREIRRILDGHIMFIVPRQPVIDYKFAHYTRFESHYDLANLLWTEGYEIVKLYEKGWAVNVVIAKTT